MITSSLTTNSAITGVILAVRSQPAVGNEYSVSAQFNRVLTQKELKNLIASERDQERYFLEGLGV